MYNEDLAKLPVTLRIFSSLDAVENKPRRVFTTSLINEGRNSVGPRLVKTD